MIDNVNICDYITEGTQQSTEISSDKESDSSSESFDSPSDDEDMRLVFIGF